MPLKRHPSKTQTNNGRKFHKKLAEQLFFEPKQNHAGLCLKEIAQGKYNASLSQNAWETDVCGEKKIGFFQALFTNNGRDFTSMHEGEKMVNTDEKDSHEAYVSGDI
jgi:hypothetical protein